MSSLKALALAAPAFMHREFYKGQPIESRSLEMLQILASSGYITGTWQEIETRTNNSLRSKYLEDPIFARKVLNVFVKQVRTEDPPNRLDRIVNRLREAQLLPMRMTENLPEYDAYCEIGKEYLNHRKDVDPDIARALVCVGYPLESVEIENGIKEKWDEQIKRIHRLYFSARELAEGESAENEVVRTIGSLIDENLPCEPLAKLLDRHIQTLMRDWEESSDKGNPRTIREYRQYIEQAARVKAVVYGDNSVEVFESNNKKIKQYGFDPIQSYFIMESSGIRNAIGHNLQILCEHHKLDQESLYAFFDSIWLIASAVGAVGIRCEFDKYSRNLLRVPEAARQCQGLLPDNCDQLCEYVDVVMDEHLEGGPHGHTDKPELSLVAAYFFSLLLAEGSTNEEVKRKVHLYLGILEFEWNMQASSSRFDQVPKMDPYAQFYRIYLQLQELSKRIQKPKSLYSCSDFKEELEPTIFGLERLSQGMDLPFRYRMCAAASLVHLRFIMRMESPRENELVDMLILLWMHCGQADQIDQKYLCAENYGHFENRLEAFEILYQMSLGNLFFQNGEPVKKHRAQQVYDGSDRINEKYRDTKSTTLYPEDLPQAIGFRPNEIRGYLECLADCYQMKGDYYKALSILGLFPQHVQEKMGLVRALMEKEEDASTLQSNESVPPSYRHALEFATHINEKLPTIAREQIKMAYFGSLLGVSNNIGKYEDGSTHWLERLIFCQRLVIEREIGNYRETFERFAGIIINNPESLFAKDTSKMIQCVVSEQEYTQEFHLIDSVPEGLAKRFEIELILINYLTSLCLSCDLQNGEDVKAAEQKIEEERKYIENNFGFTPFMYGEINLKDFASGNCMPLFLGPIVYPVHDPAADFGLTSEVLPHWEDVYENNLFSPPAHYQFCVELIKYAKELKNKDSDHKPSSSKDGSSREPSEDELTLDKLPPSTTPSDSEELHNDETETGDMKGSIDKTEPDPLLQELMCAVEKLKDKEAGSEAVKQVFVTLNMNFQAIQQSCSQITINNLVLQLPKFGSAEDVQQQLNRRAKEKISAEEISEEVMHVLNEDKADLIERLRSLEERMRSNEERTTLIEEIIEPLAKELKLRGELERKIRLLFKGDDDKGSRRLFFGYVVRKLQSHFHGIFALDSEKVQWVGNKKDLALDCSIGVLEAVTDFALTAAVGAVAAVTFGGGLVLELFVPIISHLFWAAVKEAVQSQTDKLRQESVAQRAVGILGQVTAQAEGSIWLQYGASGYNFYIFSIAWALTDMFQDYARVCEPDGIRLIVDDWFNGYKDMVKAYGKARLKAEKDSDDLDEDDWSPLGVNVGGQSELRNKELKLTVKDRKWKLKGIYFHAPTGYPDEGEPKKYVFTECRLKDRTDLRLTDAKDYMPLYFLSQESAREYQQEHVERKMRKKLKPSRVQRLFSRRELNSLEIEVGARFEKAKKDLEEKRTAYKVQCESIEARIKEAKGKEQKKIKEELSAVNEQYQSAKERADDPLEFEWTPSDCFSFQKAQKFIVTADPLPAPQGEDSRRKEKAEGNATDQPKAGEVSGDNDRTLEANVRILQKKEYDELISRVKFLESRVATLEHKNNTSFIFADFDLAEEKIEGKEKARQSAGFSRTVG